MRSSCTSFLLVVLVLLSTLSCLLVLQSKRGKIQFQSEIKRTVGKMSSSDDIDSTSEVEKSDDCSESSGSEAVARKRRKVASPDLSAPKKGSVSGKRKRQQGKKRFQSSWLSDGLFKSWLRAVDNDPYSAHCKACNCSIKCGRSELQKHAQCKKHKVAVKQLTTSVPIHDAFKSRSEQVQLREQVKKSEIHLAAFYADHNVAIDTADHLLPLLKKVAPDSKIVQEMSMDRTKCTAILQNVIAKVETDELTTILREIKFSVLIDESSDVANKKNMCLLARFVTKSKKNWTVRTELLELIQLDARDCSGAAIYEKFKISLAEKDIPIKNVVGLACDNAPVNTGAHNSFFSRLKVDCPWVVLLGCICHTSALISAAACAKLPSNVFKLLNDVSTYVSGSPKRSAELEDFQEFYQETHGKVLKPAKTRWLVLQPCITRLLGEWNTLTAYFRLISFENEKDKEAAQIFRELSNPFTKAYLFFLKYVLDFFNRFNALFQSSKILIHKLVESSENILKQLSQNFLKPELLSKLASLNLTHPSHQVPLEQIFLGTECEKTLEAIPVPNDPERKKTSTQLKAQRAADIHTFRLKCLEFYVKAIEEMQNRLPIKDKLFKELKFLDPVVALSFTERQDLPDLSKLCEKFASVLGLDPSCLALEWRTLPAMVPDGLKEKILDMNPAEAWAEISALKNFESDSPLLPQLTRLAETALSFPHANADAERIFSMVTDLKTKKRNRMGADSLNALCVTRSAFRSKGVSCISFDVRKEHLVKHNASAGTSMYPAHRKL